MTAVMLSSASLSISMVSLSVSGVAVGAAVSVMLSCGDVGAGLSSELSHAIAARSRILKISDAAIPMCLFILLSLVLCDGLRLVAA